MDRTIVLNGRAYCPFPKEFRCQSWHVNGSVRLCLARGSKDGHLTPFPKPVPFSRMAKGFSEAIQRCLQSLLPVVRPSLSNSNPAVPEKIGNPGTARLILADLIYTAEFLEQLDPSEDRSAFVVSLRIARKSLRTDDVAGALAWEKKCGERYARCPNAS